MFQLLKLTLREKKWLFLAFASTLFVSLFTYVFVDLVQPIVDDMLRLAPQGSAAAAAPTSARALDLLWNFLRISRILCEGQIGECTDSDVFGDVYDYRSNCRRHDYNLHFPRITLLLFCGFSMYFIFKNSPYQTGIYSIGEAGPGFALA